MRPITAADLMNPKVLAVREDMTLRELAAYLIHHQITGAPVEDGGGRMVGVVSTVDIAEAMLAGPADADIDADAGAAAGVDLGPGPGAVAAEVAGNAGNALDALDALDEEDEPYLPEDDVLVRDIMTPAIDSVPEDATVSEVASRMLDSHVHRLLVTRDGRPVGIITTSDLLGLLIDE
ncbi:MAG TPA: CBS domain-containing protein [Thermoanaerobaculia bacterium]|nr:CBS domain-containing protein [Thermoanaerobaculia bacterium]